jgi:PHD/YefM family antitoxin component YafN of YafNO toxin-antitoxin module
MIIKPSAAIRTHYNDISKLCKETGEPVYLTKNGAGDLVVMDIESFTRRENALKLREALLTSEAQRLAGVPGFTIDETVERMRQVVEGVIDDKK